MLSQLFSSARPHMESRFSDIPFRSSSPRELDSTSSRDAKNTLPRFHALTRSPMTIPRTSKGADAPPPLPPPRHIESLHAGQDHGWHFGNDNRSLETTSPYDSVAPGSSLLGGGQYRQHRPPERKVDFSSSDDQPLPHISAKLGDIRREVSGPVGLNQRIPDLAALLEYNKLHGERQLGQRNWEDSSQAYDKSVLQRIGGPGTPPRSSGPVSPNHPSHEEPAATHRNDVQRTNGSIRPLSLPERRHSSNDVERPSLAASHSSKLSPSLSGLRSPMSDDGLERVTQLRRLAAASTSLADDSVKGEGHGGHNSHTHYRDSRTASPTTQHLPLDDRPRSSHDDFHHAQKVGQKRRAVSPPASDHHFDPRLHAYNGPGDWSSRQLGITGSRPLQNARLQSQIGSYSSSVSSIPRSSGSYGSSYATSGAGTPATSYSSDAMPSPSFHDQHHESNGFSSQQASATQQQQAHPSDPRAEESMPPPPQPSGNRAPPVPHRRTTSSSVQRAPGLWICDCCPKKPKKFESEDDLRVHEMEKQYVCQYCNNRFKNKNEAERHQNSLHLRTHSWSCAQLTTFEMAFHPTPQSNIPISQPGNSHPTYPPANGTDTCGYCGMVFENPPNWDERVGHLNNVHKFGECNQSKKFFRADHFRQHLKHSHAGTSGKWTNMLENACMKEEAITPPSHHQQPQQPMVQSQHIGSTRRMEEIRRQY